MATTYGTSHFTSLSAAVRYYKDYGYDKADVQRKIREGEIHIGKPTVKVGERLGTTDGGKRYTITSNPRGRKRNPLTVGLPRNKWVNARVRVTSGGKIQATVDENVLGNLFGKGKSKNKRKRATNKRKRTTTARRKR